MNDFFRNTKSRKIFLAMTAFIALGAILMLSRRFLKEPEEYIRDVFYGNAEVHVEAFAERESFERETAIEARLEEFFAMVENAGKVRVMVNLPNNRETVFAIDTNESRSYTSEQDSQGGTRETHQHQSAEKTVILKDRQGTDTPLVLREIEPRIEGIVIIAEGGDCPFVRDALTRAARAVLGLEAHLVQVLTMKIN
jgi:stage III sporulation protein AG